MMEMLFEGVIAIAATLWRTSRFARRKPDQARMALASKLHLHFDPDRDKDLADQYGFLNKLRMGTNRYAFNVFHGNYRGHQVTVFDYHHEVHALESKGRNPEHRCFSCLILHLPGSLSELTIAKEGLGAKAVQAVGCDDIDFESHEFSRRFCVRSPNKKFAYDVCHPRMIEYLLANDDLTVEIEQDVLAILFDSRLPLERIEPNLKRLVALRGLLPEYLFAGS